MDCSIKQRDIIIDMLKGFAVLSVILGHAIQRGIGINGGDYFGNFLFKIIYTYHMPLFMLISGYSLFKFTREYDLKFIFKRTFRLLIPTFVWSYLIWIARDFDFVGIKEFVAFPNSILEYSKTLFFNPDFIIWFLYVVFIFDIWFMIQKKINKTADIHIDVLLSVFFYLILKLLPFSYFGILKLQIYFPIFAFGYYLTPFCLKKLQSLCMCIFLLIYIILLLIYQNTFLINMAAYYLISLIAIAFIYQVVIRIKSKSLKNFLSFFGRYSLEMYLCQCLCLNIGFGNGFFKVLTIFISATIISTMLSIITNKIWIFRFILYGSYKK